MAPKINCFYVHLAAAIPAEQHFGFDGRLSRRTDLRLYTFSFFLFFIIVFIFHLLLFLFFLLWWLLLLLLLLFFALFLFLSIFVL